MTTVVQEPDVVLGMTLDEANDYVKENFVYRGVYRVEYVTDNANKDIRHERLQVDLDNAGKIQSFRF